MMTESWIEHEQKRIAGWTKKDIFNYYRRLLGGQIESHVSLAKQIATLTEERDEAQVKLERLRETDVGRSYADACELAQRVCKLLPGTPADIAERLLGSGVNAHRLREALRDLERLSDGDHLEGPGEG